MTASDLKNRDVIIQAFCPEPKVYTVPEVAKTLRVDVHYVYDLVKNGVLPAIKLNTWKITAKSLNEFLVAYEGCEITKDMEVMRVCPAVV